MRIPRIKLAGRSAVYHCMTRTVAGEMLLGDSEKEKLRDMLWKQAAFCGVEIAFRRDGAGLEELRERSFCRIPGPFSPKRQTGARALRGIGGRLGNLAAARDLQQEPFG